MRLSIVCLTVLFGLVWSCQAWSAELCATNSTQLQQHLATAASNGEDDVIRIATGIYPAPSSTFLYDAAVAEEFDLTLIGGWTEFFGNSCGLVLTGNPIETKLDGGGEHKVMWLTIRQTSSLIVRNLTFQNGVQGGGPCDSGLHIGIPTGGGATYSGDITIENNAFLYNKDSCNSALMIFHQNLVEDVKVRIVNNIFSGNESTGSTTSCAAAKFTLSGGDSGFGGAGIYVTNNTVVGNSTLDSETTAAFCISGDIPTMYVANNNFWGNSNGGLRVEAGAGVTFSLYNNNIDSRTGSTPSNMANNMSIKPDYLPCQNLPLYCLLNPRLIPATDSPLVDAGVHPPQFFPQWYLTSSDLLGQPRVDVAGGIVDIGAFENNDRTFADRFED